MTSSPYICKVMSSSRNSVTEQREVNNEKLINEVQNHRGLWDQTSSDYGNRSLKTKHWEAVASELNQTVAEVKNRWKLLKDSFNREVRNRAKNGNNYSKWIHFDQMSFLLKGSNSLLWPRSNGDTESDSGYLSHSITEIEAEIHNTTFNSCDNELSENSFPIIEEQETLLPRKKKHKTYHLPIRSSVDMSNSVQMNPQTNWIEATSCNPDYANEDYYFLMSLLPSFERLSPKQKMLVKIKLLKDVYEAAFEGKNTSLSHNDCENNLND